MDEGDVTPLSPSRQSESHSPDTLQLATLPNASQSSTLVETEPPRTLEPTSESSTAVSESSQQNQKTSVRRSFCSGLSLFDRANIRSDILALIGLVIGAVAVYAGWKALIFAAWESKHDFRDGCQGDRVSEPNPKYPSAT